jgi:benzoyl-CoA reductase/2-hydroxyglutaryl-CoA dehydratase subunit BcrC/BadD/HgdB
MRPAMMEYNFDWIMKSTFEAASKLPRGTQKEQEIVFGCAPYFQGILGAIFGVGKPGVKLLEMLSAYFDNILKARGRGHKVCMTSFVQTPAIFYANDVMPLSMELMSAFGSLMWKRGTYDYLDHATQIGLPETSCSSQRGSMGAYLAGLGEKADFVINNMAGSCDTNVNAFAFAAEYLDIPFEHQSYPATLGDERSENFHVQDFKNTIKFLEEQTGTPMDEDRLREVCLEIDKQDALIRDIEDLQQLKPNPVPGICGMFQTTGRCTCQGLPEFTALLESIVELSKENAAKGLSGTKSGKEKARCLVTYIDHYTLDVSFFNWLYDNDISYIGGCVANALSDKSLLADYSPGYTMDTTNLDTMLYSLAQLNARQPMPRMVRGPYDGPNQWLDEALAMSKIYDTDCMIYSGTPGCRNTWGMVKPFAREMEKHGYPIHIVYADAFDERVESWSATQERLEEFFQVRGIL